MPPGDLRAIIGPNGAGKTTLFNLLSGDLAHDSGQIYFVGDEVSGLPPHQLCRRGMGRTFQITSIFRRLTALENVQTAFLTHHRRHYNVLVPARRLYRDEALALLERVGLREQAAKPSGILAHGDQRRLELAIALASAPRLLLLDEPTAGMAPRERHEIMALVAGIAARHRPHRRVHRARHGRGVRGGPADHGAAPGRGARRGRARRGARQRRRAARLPRPAAAAR